MNKNKMSFSELAIELVEKQLKQEENLMMEWLEINKNNYDLRYISFRQESNSAKTLDLKAVTITATYRVAVLYNGQVIDYL